MSKNNLQKLELTWIGKGNEPKLEPRILIEDPSKSFGDPNSENMLIHGDNLLALKALEQNFTEKIKSLKILATAAIQNMYSMALPILYIISL